MAEFIAECRAYGHEAAVPFHLHGLNPNPVRLDTLLREAASLHATPYRRELVIKPV
jgi:hypothetical protein